jgi:phosphatidylinositol-3-phosphatase
MANIKRIVLGTLVAAAGCAGNTSGNTNATCSALTATKAFAPPAFKGSVFTVVMENRSRHDIVGNSAAPYINSLIKTNALANGYHDSYVHPSEPNYFWMVAGENFGVLDDADPSAHHLESTSHIADQLELADLTWKSYQEGMGAPCGLKSHDKYAAKHNPFVYFNDVNGWDGKQFNPAPRCNDHVVDYSQLDADIAANAVPKYAFITPNLDNDMHDAPIQTGDAWLSHELPKLMATDNYKNGGVIFLLWDEGASDLSGPEDDPPFIAISPMIKPGYVSTTVYDTSSYLKTVQKLLGVDQLPCTKNGAAVKSMDDLFTASLAP